ncbi:MAG: prolyl oligopeptidase family serine peptidase [Pseudomonadota bacterium]
MKRVLRFLRNCLLALLAVVALCGALLGYFVYSPAPERPQLSGTLARQVIEVDGIKRRYLTYIPQALKAGSPLMLVMHGSGESADQIRVETGYGFERLADQHGFALAYPDSLSFDWNDCSKIGSYTVNGKLVDDVGFLKSLTDKLVKELDADRSRVFATGVSSGGFMSLRLALEAPAQFRAVAAVSANVQAPDNFKCKPAGQGTSVMIMNGTKDPLVPFDGGEANLLGFFYKSGNVMSSQKSTQYFADLNRIAGDGTLAANASVKQQRWNSAGRTQVELVTIVGGGHGLPQPWYRRARLLGPSPMAPDGPAMIWEFFDRQARQD